MKICITSDGNTLDSPIDPRFGRCKYFIFVDSETMLYESVENPNIDSSGGAGIQSAQLVIDKKAGAVITGNAGPNAFTTLTAGNIAVITGVSGTVQSAVEKYNKGNLKPIEKPNVDSHFGISNK